MFLVGQKSNPQTKRLWNVSYLKSLRNFTQLNINLLKNSSESKTPLKDIFGDVNLFIWGVRFLFIVSKNSGINHLWKHTYAPKTNNL